MRQRLHAVRLDAYAIDASWNRFHMLAKSYFYEAIEQPVRQDPVHQYRGFCALTDDVAGPNPAAVGNQGDFVCNSCGGNAF